MGGAQLEVRLLGPLEMTSQGRAVQVGGPKPRALLVALALDPGRVVSVDRLLESLWPGDPPDTAAHAVQVYVSQLRKALGNDVISTRPPGYVLELDPAWVDAHRFARLVGEGREALGGGDPATASSLLREALALWRGPALADFTYEPFAQAEIARFEELREAALEDRIEADLVLGRHAEALSELEALVEAQPLRERPRAQLMLALYRSGRQADALAAYRDARETLVEELGIDPGPELKALEAAILRQDESLLPLEAPAAPPMQFRRLVTILFVDVVESMALSAALDAEAVGRILSDYFDAVTAAVQRHGGTVEKYAGDAVMAVFGIPVSHEDDALRAAKAALEVRAAAAALDARLADAHGIGLQVRIGLESGEVVTTPTETRQRLVTGEAVGIASRLEQAAEPNEIVVGEVAARLIDHAARLQPLGEVEIKGLARPIAALRLLELEPVSPAFERRLDARLVGRKRELAALRRSLKEAIDGAFARAALVVGPPGVGKSRLAAELVRRAKGITTLRGRCLAYGEGITYWPVREALEDAPPGDERDALLFALDAETPPPAAEIAWAFRRLCEAIARERPVVLVLDDVHWAEATFLDLVEQLVDKGEGPILVVCLAREELLEARPDFLGERERVLRIDLDRLLAEDADALLDALGGEILETDQRTRIVEAAEGNPLFLEQLLALGLEGGLTGDELPLTVQALLAARLDRLGPGERAVLERGSIVLRSFTHDDVVALLEPEAAPTVDAHLETLVARGFLRPSEDGYRFRHVVVQDAVYRAAPKRLRAELHERFADRLDRTTQDLVELDEFVGYHLERAYQLRTELGEADRRTERLASDAGRRLGEAGIRAWKRVDVHATTRLLERATALLPRDDPVRLGCLVELAIAVRTSEDLSRAAKLLDEALVEGQAAGDRGAELQARIEREYVRLLQEPGIKAAALLDVTTEGIASFETLGDERALGRTWMLHGLVQGGYLGRHKAWEKAAERALVHYTNAGWPSATCLGQVAAALYYGPTPVAAGIARCQALLRDPAVDSVGEAHVTAFLGGLVAQRGEFEDAHTHIASSREIYEELGQRAAAATFCGTLLADVELLAGDAIAAEETLRNLCAELEISGNYSSLASRAGDLAEALYLRGDLEGAQDWTLVAEARAGDDDLDAQTYWRSVRAKVHARQGAFDVAEELADEAARLIGESDGLNRRAKVQANLGEVLDLAGRNDGASAAFGRAAELYERKGNVVGVARTRALLGGVAIV